MPPMPEPTACRPDAYEKHIPEAPFYFALCNHWSQCGIGFAFGFGWYEGRKYERTFSSVYTIHKMLDATDEFPGLKVGLELDAYAYEEVAKEDPACIERIKRYINSGKAAVEGGTYAQPLGQDYGWEANIRQLTWGRKAIREVLGCDVVTFLVEEQWFHPQLPQLLTKAGFTAASLQCQNSGQVKPMNETMIYWVGRDGSAIPTLPANNLIVSCVRQYIDYNEYKEQLAQYEQPLLFQWVEVWTPGMDWGASVAPFAPAIRQALEWGARCVSLTDYFSATSQLASMPSVYIRLDESGYANNWYQGGGWGYEGDRVISFDKQAEQRLLAYETLATSLTVLGKVSYPATQLRNLWRTLLISQNHDASVARTYRVFNPDGLRTTAGDLTLAQYRSVITEAYTSATASLAQLTERSTPGIAIWNGSGVAHQATISFVPPAGDSFTLYQNGRKLPMQLASHHEDAGQVLTVVDLPAIGTTCLEFAEPAMVQAFPAPKVINGCAECSIEDDRFHVAWVPNTWRVEVTEKHTGTTVEYCGFSGPIAKQNEHGGEYPALSPAHAIFTFAFEGTGHAPDQVATAGRRIKASIIECGSVRSTIEVTSNLLTLHTTPTPAAFARMLVSVEHITGRIECMSYLYAGVTISLNCWAGFRHNLQEATYTRDYPFGEEETNNTETYANSYVRVASPSGQGFSLVHPGVQRIRINSNSNGGHVEHLLVRGPVLNAYTWRFGLYFGNHAPHDSARLAKREHAALVTVPGTVPMLSMCEVNDPRIIHSAFYHEDGAAILRLVNYSNDDLPNAVLTWAFPVHTALVVDLMGNPTGSTWQIMPEKDNHGDHISIATGSMKPWEIVTLRIE